MQKNIKTKREIIRVAGRLKEIVTIKDEKGDILHKIMSPLRVEFYPRDFIQVMIGATLLAIPVGFTEELWNLGQTLPTLNVISILIVSILFISIFVYYNYYKDRGDTYRDEFIKRVIATYLVSFIVVAVFLTIIQRTPWATDWILALKRVILVAFPASMSAAIADMIK